MKLVSASIMKDEWTVILTGLIAARSVLTDDSEE